MTVEEYIVKVIEQAYGFSNYDAKSLMEKFNHILTVRDARDEYGFLRKRGEQMVNGWYNKYCKRNSEKQIPLETVTHIVDSLGEFIGVNTESILEEDITYKIIEWLTDTFYFVPKDFVLREDEIEEDNQSQAEPIIKESSPEKDFAHDLIMSGANVCILGKAGTGKSTFLREIVKELNDKGKNVAVLAPTGVAAFNVDGQTIHSFFRFGLTPFPKSHSDPSFREKIEAVDVIIIDEISMVRADILDSIDNTLRIHSNYQECMWGRKQMVFMGDVLQLPPVIKDDVKEILYDRYGGNCSYFFFDSNAYKNDIDFHTIEFSHIYRQSDDTFKSMLNRVRSNEVIDADLGEFNTRCVALNPQLVQELKREKKYIILCTTNEEVDNTNKRFLDKQKGEVFTYEGIIEGEYNVNDSIIPQVIEIKVGCRVMICSNGDGYKNGSLGFVTDASNYSISVCVDDTGEVVTIKRTTTESYKYVLKKGRIEKTKVGSMTQMPIKLGYAITIHKSQGLTFDSMLLYTDRGMFTPSQLYVALSRVRSLNSLYITKPITRRMIFINELVVKYLNKVNYCTEKENYLK